MPEENKPSLPQQVAIRSLTTPPNESQEEYYNQVSIIRGLSTVNQLMRLEMRAYGYRYSFLQQAWIKATEPIMNTLGINKLMFFLETLGDLASFSYFEKQDIPNLAMFFYQKAYVEFVVYAEKYGLKENRRAEVSNALFFFAISVLNNAKNAGHRNTVRGVLSENVLAKALGSTAESDEKKKGFFRRIFSRGNK